MIRTVLNSIAATVHMSAGTRMAAATAVIALASTWATPGLAAPERERRPEFNIRERSLADGIMSFADQAGVQVVMRADQIRGFSARPIVGRYSAREALRLLIGNAAVVTEWIGPNTVAIRLAPAKLQRASLVIQDTPVRTADAAAADTAEAPSGAEEIVVTARKRLETSLETPVVLTAIGRAEIERRAINTIDAIARTVPQLVSGEAGGIIGGNISLRGISGADANPFGEQAVSFNIDGIQIARATVRRMSEMDLAQVEVLKGPQALFFGKNSPGGIISIRTADPTPRFEAKASLGYEFNAHEWRGEGYVAGPLTEDLGFRMAAYVSHMRGWLTNLVPETSPFAPKDRHLPQGEDFALRGTLKWEPSDTVSARFKLGYSEVDNSGPQSASQIIHCPLGRPQFSAIDECRINDRVTRGDLGPLFSNFYREFGNGVPYFRQNQLISSLELNVDLADDLTLTSVTGFFNSSSRVRENYTNTENPIFMLASRGRYLIRELTEELRLASSFDGPFNFLVGGLLQKSKVNNGTIVMTNANAPVPANEYFLEQKGHAYSMFGQVSFKPVEELEIAAGGRYSKEHKKLTTVERFGAPVLTSFPRKDSWNNFSPEVTVTYRPTQTLTLFGAYKRGFLSGGFNAGASNFAGDLRFDQQTIRGFEGGVKAALLDRRLRTNFAVYKYDIRGLQISTLNVITQLISNAGAVEVKGAEFDFSYTPLPGLNLHGAVAYNKARYDVFIAGCYRGQTRALGCSLNPNAAGNGTAQDLAGQALPRAPDWAGNIGFSYETHITRGLKFALAGDASFSDGYFGESTNRPMGRQKGYTLLDASLRLAEADDAWEVALIGRNLTNRYYFSRSAEVPFSGTPGGGVTGRFADTAATLNRGREVMLRFSVKLSQ